MGSIRWVRRLGFNPKGLDEAEFAKATDLEFLNQVFSRKEDTRCQPTLVLDACLRGNDGVNSDLEIFLTQDFVRYKRNRPDQKDLGGVWCEE